MSRAKREGGYFGKIAGKHVRFHGYKYPSLRVLVILDGVVYKEGRAIRGAV